MFGQRPVLPRQSGSKVIRAERLSRKSTLQSITQGFGLVICLQGRIRGTLRFDEISTALHDSIANLCPTEDILRCGTSRGLLCSVLSAIGSNSRLILCGHSFGQVVAAD